MGILLPNGTVLPDAPGANGLPPMPGEGIVPPAAPQYNFAGPVAAAPAVAPPTADSFAPSPPKTGALAKVGGIMSTLLGWKHAEEQKKREERVAFLQASIHDGLTNPNSRLPREDLDKYVNELSQNLESQQAPNIGKIMKNHVEQVFHSRDLAKKQQQVAQAQPVAQAPPVVPSQTLAPPEGAAPSPPGAAPIPFGGGAGNGAEPAPLKNVNPAVRTASVTGGAGFVPPPTASAMPVAPSDQPGRHIISRAQLGQELAQQAVAGQRVSNAYDDERIQAAFKRLETIIGPDKMKQLRPSQVAQFLKDGTLPEIKGELVGKDQILYHPGGDVVAGVREPIQTQPGSTTTLLAPIGGVEPGTVFNPNNPMKNAPAGLGGAPSATPGAASIGERTISGGPALSTAQQAANAWWAAKNPGQPITPENYADAMAGYTEASMSASAKQLRDAQITSAKEAARMRQVQEAHLRQTMMEFNRTKGPEAINAIADQVRLNPDLMQSLSPEVKNLVITEFPKKFGLPAPRQIPTASRTSEINSQLALSNVAQMREALKNPVLQKRLGAWDGRLGNIEQTFGDTAGLKPEDSRAIQKFRSGLTYLFMTEGKALFSGRAPVAMMQELKKTSPNVTMGIPLIQGSLDAVEDTANGIIKNANEYRYGGTAMANPPAGTPTHNVPGIGDTVNGGRVLKITPVK